jgi:hypothetical protein
VSAEETLDNSYPSIIPSIYDECLASTRPLEVQSTCSRARHQPPSLEDHLQYVPTVRTGTGSECEGSPLMSGPCFGSNLHL